MQYLTSGRPCMLLAQPICEGLYKLRNNKTGTSNKNLMRSLVGSALNAYVPVDMLRYDQNLREQGPGEVPCHAVYMVTVTYDRAHDVPETFMRATRDLVRMRNGLYESMRQWKDMVLVIDMGAFEVHFSARDKNKQATSLGPRPFVKTDGCPCRCKHPCPCPCSECVCEKSTSSDPLVRLGHQVSRSSLLGACHIHLMVYVVSLKTTARPNTTMIRNALQYRSPNLHVKEVHIGEPSMHLWKGQSVGQHRLALPPKRQRLGRKCTLWRGRCCTS